MGRLVHRQIFVNKNDSFEFNSLQEVHQDDWFNVESLGSIMMLDLPESIWWRTIFFWNDSHVVK